LHCNIIKFQLNAAGEKRKQKSCQSVGPRISEPLSTIPTISIIWKTDGPAGSPCQLCPFSQLTTLGGCEIFLHIFRCSGGRSCLVFQPMQIAVEVNLKALNIYTSPLDHTEETEDYIYMIY